MQVYLQQRYEKLDVDAFREEGKRFKSQIHLIIIAEIVEDQLVEI